MTATNRPCWAISLLTESFSARFYVPEAAGERSQTATAPIPMVPHSPSVPAKWDTQRRQPMALGPGTPDGSRRSSAPTGEERQNDVARLSPPADPHLEGYAAPYSTIGEPEALWKETTLVQTGPVRDQHAPLARRPWVLLHHVGPRATGDRHSHHDSRIDNRRELVPGELSPSARVGRIHGRPQARPRKIPSAESDVIWPDGGQSAGELRRFLITGKDLRVRRSAHDSGRTAGF